MFGLVPVGKTERLKSEPFGNGTTLESAEIRMFGFQTFTVFDSVLNFEFDF